MKNILVIILLFLAIFAYSYEWVNLNNDESNTYHMYNSLNNGNIYYSTSEGVRVFAGDDNNLYGYGSLAALGVAENDIARFVIFGSGSYSDGLYTLDDSGNIDLVDWYYEPRLLDTGLHTNSIYFSSENNFQINQGNEWQAPAEFFNKDVFDVTESASHQFVATNDGFYHKFTADNDLFANRQNFGTIQSNEIDEASGLVASRNNRGVLWTLNDSGGGNFLFAMNELGQHLGIYTVDGITNRDWEDIAIGNNPTTGEAEIYIADIGDNQLSNETKYIYIAPEPYVSSSQDPTAENILLSQTISFVYPDNEKYDSETLLFDQRTETFYLITKRHSGDTEYTEKIFSLNYDISETVQVANFVGEVEIPVDELVNQGATGGDISPDGNFILIKNYQNMYLWERRNLTIPQALSQPFIEVPYIMEPQGEAVAWRYDNQGYYTVSEEYGNTPAVLYFYSKKGWRKASPLPFKKIEYNSNNGKLYGIIQNDEENSGLWQGSNFGIIWQQINNYPNYNDIAVDASGVVFLTHTPTVIPEDWERITAYNDGEFIDLSSGLENKIVNRLVNNRLLDSATVFACTNQGVFFLQDYQALANDSNDIEVAPSLITYPNPFKQELTMQTPKGKIKSGRIYNLKGQLVVDFARDKKIGSEELVWEPSSSIPNGIYFIKIQTTEGNFTSKVLKIN